MPRIRTIKPQFWEDEKIAQLSISARLMFIGIWNFADDEGIIIWRSEYLRSRIFPYDSFSPNEIEQLERELIRSNLVFPYKHRNESYAAILNFHKHQVINRPQNSVLRPPSLENNKYRYAIFKRDRYICHYCGRHCRSKSFVEICENPEDAGRSQPTVDHIIPLAKGGTNYPRNLARPISCVMNKTGRL